MASMVAKGCNSSQLPSPMSIQEKGSRNKRKFHSDPPLCDPNDVLSSVQNECPSYEFSAEKFDFIQSHGESGGCDMCGVPVDHSDTLKLDLGLATTPGSCEVEQNRIGEEIIPCEFYDAAWSDLTEIQLEELVLSNLDATFKSAIKKIVDCGYYEEAATKAVLRTGLCYGCKDTVSDIVDNTLAYLKNGQEIDPSRRHYFEDLQQLEKYILVQLVCVLREIRPFFSIGDAMWCLLICDMDVSLACAMEGDPLSRFVGVGASNGGLSVPPDPQLKAETKSSELNLPDPCKPTPSNPHIRSSQFDILSAAESLNETKQKTPLSGQASDMENPISTCDNSDKSFGAVGTSQEEKFTTSRKVHSSSAKRESVLRHKSFHLEKNYRTYGSKGGRSRKLGSLGGLILDKKLNSVSNATGITLKSGSLKISRAVAVDVPQGSGNHNISTNAGPSSTAAFSVESVNMVSAVPKIKTLSTPPSMNNLPASSAADTELSLSLPSYARMPKSMMHFPQKTKDKMILKIIEKLQGLQSQRQEWMEWANQKVMQAARRLSKDKPELKTLRLDKDEEERIKKERQTLEENTMKKLSEMENAMCKASGQVERASSAVRRLEVENAALRHEKETASMRAAESAASCLEVSKREKKTLTKFQSCEKQKSLFQEELLIEKHRWAQLEQELQQAKDLLNQVEARWRQEEKAKEGLLAEANSLRKEREQIEVSTKSKEDAIKFKEENSFQRYKGEIQKLEKEISQRRLKSDSLKIAALRRGIEGSYASKLTNAGNGPNQKDQRAKNISELVTDLNKHSGKGGVKRERECVMCLSEEMSVVFLPCAHQVVCKKCNELHEKQGMKDCPSCRTPIQSRILVQYAKP